MLSRRADRTFGRSELLQYIDTRGDREIIWKDGATAGYAAFIGYDPVGASAVVVLSNAHDPVDDLGMRLLDSRQQ